MNVGFNKPEPPSEKQLQENDDTGTLFVRGLATSVDDEKLLNRFSIFVCSKVKQMTLYLIFLSIDKNIVKIIIVNNKEIKLYLIEFLNVRKI